MRRVWITAEVGDDPDLNAEPPPVASLNPHITMLIAHATVITGCHL